MSTTTFSPNVGTATTTTCCNSLSNFSLLHEDDDEEIPVVSSIVEETAPGLRQNSKDDNASENKGSTATASKNDSYESILQQASKWMVELEQIRDTTTWCHVENSFHRDVFAMMDVQALFNYPSI